jgi:hypothetical protein
VEERESDIVSAICDYLALKGHLFWPSNNVPVYGGAKGTFRRLPKYTMKGLPEITVVRKGAYIGIEVKTKKEVLSRDQVEFGRMLMHNGGTYVVARSIDDVQNAGL